MVCFLFVSYFLRGNMTSQQHGAWKDNQSIVHLWFRSKGATSLNPYPQEKRDSRWLCIYHGTLKRKHPLESVFHLENGTFMDFHCRVCLLEGRNPGRAEETIKHADKLIMILLKGSAPCRRPLGISSVAREPQNLTFWTTFARFGRFRLFVLEMVM